MVAYSLTILEPKTKLRTQLKLYLSCFIDNLLTNRSALAAPLNLDHNLSFLVLPNVVREDLHMVREYRIYSYTREGTLDYATFSHSNSLPAHHS